MGSYSVKLEPSEHKRFEEILKSEEGEFSTPQYTFYSFKNKEWQFTFYKTGKVLIQGKSPEIAYEKFFGGKNASVNTLDVNKKQGNLALYPHIGSDESGKGDFFGPLCIAGCYLTENAATELKKMGVIDSKKLDDEKILKLAESIRAMAETGFVIMRCERYNELYFKYRNLNKLLAAGHCAVLANLIEKTGATRAVLDKFADERVVLTELKKTKSKGFELIQQTKAESDTAVAAASIIARAEYVKKMHEMKEKYGFNFPKGAGGIVLEAGKKFITKFGFEELEKVSKTHFKTYAMLLHGKMQ